MLLQNVVFVLELDLHYFIQPSLCKVSSDYVVFARRAQEKVLSCVFSFLHQSWYLTLLCRQKPLIAKKSIAFAVIESVIFVAVVSGLIFQTAYQPTEYDGPIQANRSPDVVERGYHQAPIHPVVPQPQIPTLARTVYEGDKTQL